jgi:protein-S-isoprenylcysteine O-methyltransferase Ste14
MSTSTRGAAVRFPFPPLLFIGPLAVTLAVHRWLLPLNLPDGATSTVTGVALVLAGVIFSLSGVATALVHRTTVVPHHTVTRLVTTGPFRISRNPMYTGHVVALLGTALWAGSWWPLIVAPLCVLATQRLVITAEEEYLTDRFGAEYEHYRSRVRRWL